MLCRLSLLSNNFIFTGFLVSIIVMEKCKVLIVGSGASGLYAAYCLVNQKLTSDIIILEAEDRIGGRIHTVPFNDHCIDLGAQWIHGRGDNPLWKFVKENNVRNLSN
jgi:monoamine oxidase